MDIFLENLIKFKVGDVLRVIELNRIRDTILDHSNMDLENFHT